ncbi:MAG: preprotein translocase subunit YajC [Pseudomonadota bacterium]
MLDLLAAAGAEAPQAPWWNTLILFGGMGLIFWFLVLRPQIKRQKEHQERVGGLKKGDKVVTQGGLVGKVLKVDDTYVDLELAKDVRVKAVKHTIADLIEPGGKPAND